jgi:hypothetical protein
MIEPVPSICAPRMTIPLSRSANDSQRKDTGSAC